MNLVGYEDRLKKVLISDKEENPSKLINVLKSDIINILTNYMEISYDDLDVTLSIDENGLFVFNAYSKVRRLKNLSAVIE